MKMREYERLLERALPVGAKILVVGPPGVGKTVGKRNVCARLGYRYIGLSGPLLSPVKVWGYPMKPEVAGGDATHALFDGMAEAFRASGPTLLDFDDIGMATGEVMKCILDLVQFGRIDSRQLPSCVVISASSNDVGHGADVQGMVEPLKSRFEAIVHIEASVEDTVIYGLSQGWPVWLCAWVRNHPLCFEEWKPTKSLDISGVCGRGLENVSRWEARGLLDGELCAGCVGKGAAVDMMAFRALAAQLPDVDKVLLAPEHEPVPEDPGARYLVCSALAAKMDGGNFGQALKYLQRLPQSFRAFSLLSGVRVEDRRKADGKLAAGHVMISQSGAFNAWVCSQDGREILKAGSSHD
jgi:hypothetical protein